MNSRDLNPALIQRTRESDNMLFQLQSAVRDGSARRDFPVGTIIPDIWSRITSKGEIAEQYNMPLRIVDYRKVAQPAYKSICPAAILQRVNAVPVSIIFTGSQDLHNLDGRYKTSAVLRYLAGLYRQGCSQALYSVIRPIVLSDVEVSATEFFLPSAEEIHVDLDNTPGYFQYPTRHQNPHFGCLTWEYYLDTPTDYSVDCERRSFRTPNGEPADCWLRAKGDENLSRPEALCCYSNGHVGATNVDFTMSVVPAGAVY